MSKSLKRSESERQPSNVLTMTEQRTNRFRGRAKSDPNWLSPEEVKFSQIYIETGSATQAGKAIGLKDPSKDAALWLSKPKMMQHILALAERVRIEALRQEALRIPRTDEAIERLVVGRLVEIAHSPRHPVRGYADILKALCLLMEHVRRVQAEKPSRTAVRPERQQRTSDSRVCVNLDRRNEITPPLAALGTVESVRLPEAQRTSDRSSHTENGPEMPPISAGPRLVGPARAPEEGGEISRTKRNR